MEPDYVKHAKEVIDRLRLKSGSAAAQPVPQHIVINAPRDCVFVITPQAIQPNPKGKPPSGA